MAIQFCTVCGDLLPISQLRAMDCECCGETNENKQLNNVTVSSTDKFPSELRNKRSAVQTDKKLASTDTWSKIDIVCRECQAKEVRYTSLQLRGADEGSTMFYYCPACSARWSENN